jgi:hypothetical protein
VFDILFDLDEYKNINDLTIDDLLATSEEVENERK